MSFKIVKLLSSVRNDVGYSFLDRMRIDDIGAEICIFAATGQNKFTSTEVDNRMQ